MKLRFEYPPEVSFECNKCGLCCSDTPLKTRHVLLLKSDAQRIAAHIKREIATFAFDITGRAPYVYEVYKVQDGKCVFLLNNGCAIYEVRPLICRFYPFELSTAEDGVCRFSVTDECQGASRDGAAGSGKKLDASYFAGLLELAREEFRRKSE